MDNILKKIVASKQKEVEKLKQQYKQSEFESYPFFSRNGRSFAKLLRDAETPKIIAEFKRKSPSAGIINDCDSVQSVVRGYIQHGAVGVSVLTDEEYFAGTIEDLKKARQIIEAPVLRKDFIIDPIQLYQAKAFGADMVLLIAEILTTEELLELAEGAKRINLDVLCEIHSASQLEKLNSFIDIVGVNNRDLTNFEVSIDTSIQLAEQIPDEFVKISESGLTHPDEIKTLFAHGFKGFLIGGHFMEQSDPIEAAQHFMEQL